MQLKQILGIKRPRYMRLHLVFSDVRVVHVVQIYICMVIVRCYYFPLRFPRQKDVQFVLIPICFERGSCFTNVIYIYLRIRAMNNF